MATTITNDVLWERMTRAVESIRQRLERAAAALDGAAIPYAVAGDTAVAVWVGIVDQGAVRNTRDIDVLLRRSDLSKATAALASAGFVPVNSFGITMFLDGPDARPSESLHIVFAAEKVQADYALAAPDVSEAERPTTFSVLSLEALVRMKLTSFRLKDRVHVQDLIGVGLVDASWRARLPAELAARLQELLDHPEA
jgi:hypothetical protein